MTLVIEPQAVLRGGCRCARVRVNPTFNTTRTHSQRSLASSPRSSPGVAVGTFSERCNTYIQQTYIKYRIYVTAPAGVVHAAVVHAAWPWVDSSDAVQRSQSIPQRCVRPHRAWRRKFGLHSLVCSACDCAARGYDLLDLLPAVSRLLLAVRVAAVASTANAFA